MKINKKLLLSLATGLLVCGAANAAKVTLNVPDGNPGDYCVGIQGYHAQQKTSPPKTIDADFEVQYTPSALFPFQKDDNWTFELSANSFFVYPVNEGGGVSL